MPPRHSTDRPRVNVLGVGVDAIDMPTAVHRIANAAAAGRGGYVCVTGVHGVMEAQRDPTLRQILNSSLVTTPDGMPMVWLGRASGFSRMSRVYGPDLMLELCRESVARQATHFFYGGTDGVAEELAERLRQRFPGLLVVGTYTPPFRPLSAEEEQQLAQRLEQVRRMLGSSRVDVAVAARARAGLAEDLERRGAAPPALGDVGAASFLADGVELLAVDELPHLEVAGVRARRPHLHPFRPPGPVSDWLRALHG
jgi:hypothetical protein